MEIYEVNLRIQSEYGKYGPEITPYLDTFHAVLDTTDVSHFPQNLMQNVMSLVPASQNNSK